MWFYISQNTTISEELFTFNILLNSSVRNMVLNVTYSKDGTTVFKRYDISPGTSSTIIQLTKDELFESNWSSTTDKLVEFELIQNTTTMGTGNVGVNLDRYTYSVILIKATSEYMTIRYTSTVECDLSATWGTNQLIWEFGRVSPNSFGKFTFEFSKYNLVEGDTITLKAQSLTFPIVNYIISPSNIIKLINGWEVSINIMN